MNPNVDAIIEKSKKWSAELAELRTIFLECELDEEVKWKQACYTLQGKNIAILGAFKEYCAILFFKGALLKDGDGILIQPTENVQSGRQFRFTNLGEITQQKALIKSFIYEAIEVEKAGLKVPASERNEIELPSELVTEFELNKDLKSAFFKLTPGRQRAYLLFFTGAKQSKTVTDRIHKYVSRILKGQGLNDCVCGLSKRGTTCDGSHKFA